MKGNSMFHIPKEAGFYKKIIENGKTYEVCKFADSKQISADKYELQHNLYYRAKDGKIFVIKKGFIHDGASKGLLRHFGKYTNAAILHDGLYGIQHDREKSDALFDEAMKISKVSWIRRNTYWAMVRVFGGSAWSEQSKASVINNKKFMEVLGE